MDSIIKKSSTDIPISELRCSDIWQQAVALNVSQDNWPDKNPDSLPQTRAELMYSEIALYVRYTVIEKTIRAVHLQPNDPVCMDSCAELFISPDDQTYFNFETNCAGTLLLFSGTGRQGRVPVPPEIRQAIEISTSLPFGVAVENQPCPSAGWQLSMRIPFNVFTQHAGMKAPVSGIRWKGNVYKCGDQLPEPHWASWAPIETQTPDFHRPEYFGTFVFE